jgi:hypothetical protein
MLPSGRNAHLSTSIFAQRLCGHIALKCGSSMASGYKHSGGISRRVGNEQAGEDSSESDGEGEPAKSFHRRLSTSRQIKCAVSFVCSICIDHYLAGSMLLGAKEAWSLFTHIRVRDLFVDSVSRLGFTAQL